jgi:hypothetical protein
MATAPAGHARAGTMHQPASSMPIDQPTQACDSDLVQPLPGNEFHVHFAQHAGSPLPQHASLSKTYPRFHAVWDRGPRSRVPEPPRSVASQRSMPYTPAPSDWREPLVAELRQLQHAVQALSHQISTLHSQYGGALQLSLDAHARMDAVHAPVVYTAIPQLRAPQGALNSDRHFVNPVFSPSEHPVSPGMSFSGVSATPFTAPSLAPLSLAHTYSVGSMNSF